MLFERKIYQKLKAWKDESRGATSMLIEGARRTGKSTIVEEFAKKEYDSYIIIDFAKKNATVEGYFLKHMDDLDTLFMLLSTYYRVNLVKRRSVIVFDEVQAFPFARSTTKYLVADGRYDYISTGSLISIKENVKDIVIPSEENSLRMYPMDYEEFCLAMGEKPIIDYIKYCYEKRVPLERALHNKAMLLFRQYMLVGGMPQSVAAFIEEQKNLQPSDAAKRNILRIYHGDIMKIDGRYKSVVAAMFDEIPSRLSKHEKRVVFKNIDARADSREAFDALFWLGEAMITNQCFRTSDPSVALALNTDESYVKCYFSDTGLLFCQVFDSNALLEDDIYRQILNDRLSLNEGMFYENAVAQMLVAGGHRLYFYTQYNEEKHRNDIEIDFIISNNSALKYRIFPIEVKSGTNYSIVSLQRFIEKYRKRIGEAYVIHPRGFMVKDGIVYLPPYMVPYL